MGKVFINLYKRERTSFDEQYISVSGHLCGTYISLSNEEYVLIAAKTDEYYLKLYNECKNILNNFYKNNYSDVYWKYYFDSWLKPFIFNVIYKYTVIKQIVVENKDKEIFTELMDYKSSDTLRTIEEYRNSIREDEYNSKLYSMIIEYLADKYSITILNYYESKRKQNNVCVVEKRRQIRDIFKEIIKKNVLAFTRIIKPQFVLCDLGQSFAKGLMLWLKTKGEVQLWKSCSLNNTRPTNNIIRKNLSEELLKKTTDDELDYFLRRIIFREMPKSFLEDYEDIISLVKNVKVEPKYIVALTSWGNFNTLFPYWCAFMREKGAKLIGAQHGGNYFVYEGVGEFEFSNLDYFFAWLDKPKMNTSCIFLRGFPNRMISYENYKPRRQERIIFSTTAVYPYFEVYGYIRGYNFDRSQYIEKEKEFISLLDPIPRKMLYVRNYRVDGGWHLKEKLIEAFPDIKFDMYYDKNGILPGRDLYTTFQNSNLYIVDHISTTWVEALLVDIPFIMILLPTTIDDIRIEERGYFQQLASVGVLYTNVVDAARTVNKIFNNTYDWWNEAVRKNVIANVRSHFISKEHYKENFWFYDIDSIDNLN